MVDKSARASAPSSLIVEACIRLKCLSSQSACEVTVRTFEKAPFASCFNGMRCLRRSRHDKSPGDEQVKTCPADQLYKCQRHSWRWAHASEHRRAADERDREPRRSVSGVTRACRELLGAAGSRQPPRYSAPSRQEGVTQGILTLG